MEKYLYGHTNEENAYYVENYPWGFRLKTTVRYWIETNDKTNGGQRFVKQTLNPKTNKWCSPKKSTYSKIKLLYLDENEHVQTYSLNMNSTSYKEEGFLRDFYETHKEYLSDYQLKTLKLLDGFHTTMKNVKFEIKPVPFNESEEDKKKRMLEKEKSENNVLRAIDYHTLKSGVCK